MRSDFELFNKLRRRRINDFNVRRKDMKKEKFNFRDENLKRKFNIKARNRLINYN